MKITNKIMASAIAFAVGLSAAQAAEETTQWWSVDFESGYANGVAVAPVTKTDGVWSKTGADASIVTNVAVSTNSTFKVKLDTQEGSLVWAPTGGVSSCKKVLVDTDVYLVGSDEPPATDVTGVQTEVYLSTAGNSTNLYVHVRDTVGASNYWQKLSGSVSDKTWVSLQIQMIYTNTAAPRVSILVGSTPLVGVGAPGAPGTGLESFPVMNAVAGVTSVSFMGTGYLDNFVGSKVTDLVTGPTFEDGGVNTNGTAGVGTGTITTGAGVVNASFTNSLDSAPIQYVQMTGPSGYVRTARTTSGVVSFSTVDLPAGTYSITGYYGDAPTLTVDLAAPAAATVGANKAAEVADGALTLTVVPRSGLYYTAFVGTDSLTNLTAAGASVVATPADEDAGFLQISLPAPTEANGVNLIKIYASDEAYSLGNAAP